MLPSPSDVWPAYQAYLKATKARFQLQQAQQAYVTALQEFKTEVLNEQKQTLYVLPPGRNAARECVLCAEPHVLVMATPPETGAIPEMFCTRNILHNYHLHPEFGRFSVAPLYRCLDCNRYPVYPAKHQWTFDAYKAAIGHQPRFHT